MTQEFYINSGLADLPNDSVLALSFAVNTLFDVKTAQGNISNRLNLPKTANNLMLLGFLDDMTVDLTKTIRKKNTCRYVINGIEVITKGSIEIGDITDVAIGIVFTSGNLDFFDLIDSGSIQDLDLSEYDHIYDFTDIPPSRLNREGYIYPVINYGTLTNASTEVNLLAMRPATFVRTIINKIITETGYTVDDRISTDTLAADQYARMIVPFSNDSFVHGKRAVTIANQGALFVEAVGSNFDLSFPNNSSVASFKVNNFDTVVKDPGLSWTSPQYTANQTFLANISATSPRIDMSIVRGGLEVGSSAHFDLCICVNGVSVYSARQTVSYAGGSSGSLTIRNVTVEVTNYKINSGDIITFEVQAANPGGSRIIRIYSTIGLEITPAIGPIEWSDNVELEGTLPDISKKDFLKGIANLFCTIIQTDNDNKVVQLVPFRQILQNVSKSKNWSDRLVNPKLYTRNVTIGDYAQANTAHYKNDDVIENIVTGYGSANINIADENLDIAAKELFEIPFSASFESSILSGLNAVDIIKNAVTTDLDFAVSTGPRICMVEFIDVYLNWKSSNAPMYTLETYDSTPLTYFATDFSGKPGMMFDQLLQRYYFEFTNLLNDQRMTTEQMLLTPMDIQELDFFIPIYLDKFASYFYISKISSYVIGQPCNVNFIKLF